MIRFPSESDHALTFYFGNCFGKSMRIDFRIVDGRRGGLTFDFFPNMRADNGQFDDYDRFVEDAFNVREEAFLFIEGAVARAFPDWHKGYRHWGITWLPKHTWLDILAQFAELRRDIKGTARLGAIVDKHVIIPGVLPRRFKLHRKAMLRFLDQFESRVRALLDRYPYLIICGV